MYFINKTTLIVIWLLMIEVVVTAQNNRRGNEGNGDNRRVGIFHNDVPPHLYDIILGRPTNNSVAISILTNDDMTGALEYGLNPNRLDIKTDSRNFKRCEVQTIDLEHLQKDKRYYYRFNYIISNADKKLSSELNYFQTQRSEKSGFTFTVQADSHLDENTSAVIYTKSLTNVASDSADFLVDLGDTWMTDKYRNGYKESLKQYIAQRYYFGLLCKSSSLFLTLGNHDGESGQQIKKTDDNMTNWATTTRKYYYPNPFPNDFYNGNGEKENAIGYPENYFSWEWGNALFVVLDPFRFTSGNNNAWQRTLGQQQYIWLKNTLQKSKASFKFVFIHNLVGGVDLKGKGRGGVEAVKYFEWGGLDSNGVNSFSENRPDWDKPIHDLLVANHVDIVFHGHDHLFAKQDLDGIVYQLVPQPGAMRYGNTNSAAEYGYFSGNILNGPGYLRIKMEKTKATIEFVQTSIDSNHNNKEVLFTYAIQIK